jgi:hypothetical protein
MANAWFDATAKPFVGGFSEEQAETFIRTTYVGGPGRNRKRFTAAPQTTTQSYILTPGQKLVFQSWWQASTGADHGQAIFKCPLYLSSGLSTHDVRATEMYSFERHGQFLWLMSMTVELNDDPRPGGGWYEYYPEALSGAGIIDEAINEELP